MFSLRPSLRPQPLGFIPVLVLVGAPSMRVSERRFTSHLQQFAGLDVAKELDQGRRQPGPSGLVTGADAGAVVAVEVLVEEDQVAPVRVGLELFAATIDRSLAFLVAEKDLRESPGKLARDFVQVHLLARSGGELDLERVAVVR